ncbi:MAG: hypothetical protein QOE90_2221, partial [Thermoplasmata archaeon]|nr:hypothetical protein [Thermoplasmata archaeon]
MGASVPLYHGRAPTSAGMPETVASAPQPMAAPQLPRKVRTYVVLLAPLAGVVVALGVFEAAVFWPRDPEGVLLLALLAVLTGAAFALERRALVLHWRGQRTISSFDEPVVFLALALLPPAALVPLIAASMTLVQIAARRIFVKAAFNVGTYAVAAGAGAGFATLGGVLGWPPAGGAALGLLAYTFVSNVFTSALFADMESRPVVAVFRERFALATAFHVTLGIAIGVMLLALWGYHPLATLLVIPLALMTLSFMRLSASADREIVVHRKLAQVVAEIAGSQAADAVADRLLDACGDLFLAGRAELALDARSWARDFEGGPAPGRAPTAAPILAHDGRVIGAVRVWPARRVRTGAHEAEPQILKVVASQVGVAMENAVAIEELARARDQQRGILENAPAGIAMLDAGGRVVRMNVHMRDVIDALMADKSLAQALEGLAKGVAFTDVEWCHEGKCRL